MVEIQIVTVSRNCDTGIKFSKSGNMVKILNHLDSKDFSAVPR